MKVLAQSHMHGMKAHRLSMSGTLPYSEEQRDIEGDVAVLRALRGAS